MVASPVRGGEMDDNIWEYPFGELDDDEDMFYREPERLTNRLIQGADTRTIRSGLF